MRLRVLPTYRHDSKLAAFPKHERQAEHVDL